MAAMIHLPLSVLRPGEEKRFRRTTACFRREGMSFGGRDIHYVMYDEPLFVAQYNESHGRGICPKCAEALIKAGRLQAAAPESADRVIQIVRAGTQVLHDEFIQRTIEYAESYFDYCVARLANPISQWYAEYGIEVDEKGNPVSGTYNRRDIYRMRSARERMQKIVEKGKEAHKASEVKMAERHYDNSVAKLAMRIRSKGLDIEKLVVKTGHVDVNIETVMTDGNAEVRAFTIIASGPIQRPHYRYLVH